jgi:hypothetical protein
MRCCPGMSTLLGPRLEHAGPCCPACRRRMTGLPGLSATRMRGPQGPATIRALRPGLHFETGAPDQAHQRAQAARVPRAVLQQRVLQAAHVLLRPRLAALARVAVLLAAPPPLHDAPRMRPFKNVSTDICAPSSSGVLPLPRQVPIQQLANPNEPTLRVGAEAQLLAFFVQSLTFDGQHAETHLEPP